MQIIDADGHVNDRPCMEEISKYMPPGNRTQVFPAFDHIHFHFLEGGEHRSRTGTVGPKEWTEFMDDTGIDWTVVYPTAGLAVGRIISEDWAVAACRAYNNWLYEKFTHVSSRIKGMALIPIQDPQAAVDELRRAIKELGMVGAMLPSNGEGIKGHLGSKIYWPIYEEAEKLGCPLAVHVGCLHHLGMDTIGVYYPVHALGHPFGIMAQAAGTVVLRSIRSLPQAPCRFSRGRGDLGAVLHGPFGSFLSAPLASGCRWRVSAELEARRDAPANILEDTLKPAGFLSASIATTGALASR